MLNTSRAAAAVTMRGIATDTCAYVVRKIRPQSSKEETISPARQLEATLAAPSHLEEKQDAGEELINSLLLLKKDKQMPTNSK